MNLKYLIKEVLPVRYKEIEDGKNLATKYPIYVVLDLQENYVSGHTDYSLSVNYKDKGTECGYIDHFLDAEDREFCLTGEGMEEPVEVTRFYTDRIIAFFLTSMAAHNYIEYQSHNLTDPYVYVFHAGYRNDQMYRLLNDE